MRATPTPHPTLDPHDALVYTELSSVPGPPLTPQNYPVLGFLFIFARPLAGVTGQLGAILIWLGHGQGWCVFGGKST